MTVVVGRAIDISQIDLQDYNGRITFIPSGPGIRIAENSVMATRPVTAELDTDGRFSINLSATSATTPDVFYKMRLDWFQKDPLGLLVHAGVDILPWEIRVPASSIEVNITTLILENIPAQVYPCQPARNWISSRFTSSGCSS